MTRDQVQSVHDDIAYMKALAQEGRQGPLLGGSVLVAAAVIFGAATLGQWMRELGRIPNGGWESLSLWLGAAAAFASALIVLIRRIESACGGASAMNRSVGAAWSAIGYGIFVTWAALMVFGWRTGDWGVMALMPTESVCSGSRSARKSAGRQMTRLASGSMTPTPSRAPAMPTSAPTEESASLR